ncbi:hypothetical protein Gotri_011128, partial [Gossypium trilobum]|nr:hypothetical protein [Gossypium trilobum]
SRKLQVVTNCPLCQSEEEFVSHIFWDCATVKIPYKGNLIDSGVSKNIHQYDITWKLLRTNEVKGNFDAAYIDATTTKVIACLQVVLVAEDLGFRNLAVEGDSLT